MTTALGTRRIDGAFAHITPNWFASVMGTGIVATAAASLTLRLPGLRVGAVTIWLTASLALLLLTVAFTTHWVRHRPHARRYAVHPVTGQFYGAIPMAVLTIGAGTLVLGSDLIGLAAAVRIGATLWIIGTIFGLASSVWFPLRTAAGTDTLPAMLMPVVPPMVSASTGALLLPHLTPELQSIMAVACYSMFGWSMVLAVIVLARIYIRIARVGLPPVQAAPTIWITLGVVGQSITAVNLLGSEGGSHAFGVGYGLIAGVIGIGMFAFAIAVTVRAARSGLSFSLTWWSFTFPVGTCVTGATALGNALDSDVLHDVATALFAMLVLAWVTVATRTIVGVVGGELPAPA